MKIITGFTGTDHVMPEDDAAMHIGIFGENNYVLGHGNRLAYQLMANNIIRIKSGSVIYNGIHARVENYADLEIAGGTAGVTRTDVIVARYAKDDVTGIESVSLLVLTGSASAAAQPLSTDFPLYRITMNGVNVQSVTTLFTVVESMEAMKTYMKDAVKGMSLDISQIATETNQRISELETAFGKEIEEVSSSFKQADSELYDRIATERGAMEEDLRAELFALNTRIDEVVSDTQSDIAAVVSQVQDLATRVTALENSIS